MKWVIEAENLGMCFGKKEVLKELSIRVAPGTICGLLGPNGSGKTTLCKIILGLLRPQKGECRLLGESTSALPRHLLNDVALIADWQELPSYMTVSEYFAYCRSFYDRWDTGLCTQYASDFGVPLQEKIQNLSKGTQAKLSLITAFAVRPKVLIADEPFGGIDIKSKHELMELLVALTESDEWSILISSHHADELETLCDSLAFMTDNRIVVQDSLEALQTRYRRLEGVVPDVGIHHGEIPAEWLNAQVRGRTFGAVVTDYDQRRIADTLRKIGLDVSGVSVEMLSVEQLYLAIMTQFNDQTV